MNNEFLSDEEIIEVIKEYIDDNIYDRAIMIDGSWGSGKTYFVKNKLIKQLEEYKKDKKIIYISLYGIESTVDISNQIYLDYIKLNDKRIQKIAILGGKVISDLIKSKGIDLSKCIKPEDFKDFIDIHDCIIIFDDIERCKCNINDMFGYINNFIEHKSMKVIMIANEDEIGNVTDGKNKYYEKVKKKRAEKNNNISDSFSEKSENKILKVENKGNNSLQENKIEEYLRIKEKVIGATIKYKPNLNNSMISIIEFNIHDNKLEKELISSISEFRRIAEKYKHVNLRTFQFFISKISKIYSLIKDKEYMDKEEVFRTLMNYTFKVCIYYKKGLYMSEWKTNELYGEVALEPYTVDDNMSYIYPTNIIKGFKFVDDFVVYSKTLEIEIIDKTISLFLDDLKESYRKDDPLNIISEWYVMEDDEVEDCIDNIVKCLENKQYSPKRFPDILRKFINLYNVGFKKYDIGENILSLMISQINEDLYKYSCDYDYDEIKFYIDINGDEENLYTKYYKKLIKAYHENGLISYANKISDCLDDITNWGSRLNKLALDFTNNVNDYKYINGILYKLDYDKLDKLKYNIENSKTYELQNFRRFLLNLYGEHSILNLENDKDVINELLLFVQKIQSQLNINTNRVKSIQLKYLEKNLESIVNRL